LEMGVSSAQEIAKKADILRTTGYSVLEQLVVRGVIIKTKKNSVNRYFAESPESLVHRIGASLQSLEKSLPELKAIQNKNEVKPKIVFYEGLSGIRRIYDDTIKSKPEEILEFNTSDMFSSLPNNFPAEYVDARKKNKIRAKRIAPASANWKNHARKDGTELSSTILLAQAEFDIPVEINIYNDKVAFMSYSDQIGIIIEGQGIATAMRTIFELFWETKS